MLDEHPTKGPMTALDRLSDAAANAASKPPILILVVALACAWIASHWLAAPPTTQILIDIFEMITLLLVVILQNSERRAEGALNQKLDSQAEALAVLVNDADPDLAGRLRSSIEMEERQ